MGRNRTLKICHLASGDLWAGAEVQLFTLLRALKKESTLELAVVLLNDGQLAESCRDLGLPVKIINESKLSFFTIRTELADYLSSQSFDIIHSHRFKENILAATGRNRQIVKYRVQTVHGWPYGFSGTSSLKEKLTGACNRYVTRKQFDRVIAVSEDLRHSLSDEIDSPSLTMIHNAIDTEAIVPGPQSINLRQKFGLPEDALLIGSAGRLVPIKRYDLFIETARMILQDCPRARFLLAGEGPCLSELRALVEGAGLSEKFLFAGFTREILDFIRNLDVFVMTSDHEGIPMVLLEAMALARPVVVTSVGGMTEVVENGVSGLLVPPNNARAMAEACLTCLNNHESTANLGKEARLRIEEEFSAAMLKDRMMFLYHSLAESS